MSRDTVPTKETKQLRGNRLPSLSAKLYPDFPALAGKSTPRTSAVSHPGMSKQSVRGGDVIHVWPTLDYKKQLSLLRTLHEDTNSSFWKTIKNNVHVLMLVDVKCWERQGVEHVALIYYLNFLTLY